MMMKSVVQSASASSSNACTVKGMHDDDDNDARRA
jgi:hypothetical protein